MEVAENFPAGPKTRGGDNFNYVAGFPGQYLLGDFENLHNVGEAGDDKDVPKKACRKKSSSHSLNQPEGVPGSSQWLIPRVEVTMWSDRDAKVVGMIEYSEFAPML